MLTFSVLLLVLLGSIFLGLQQGDKPRIPPPRSPNGAITRIIDIILGVTALSLLIYGTALGGFTETNIVLTLNGILIATMIFMAAKRKSAKK